ncbi:hypothetical protein QWI17_18925 [Gilvimarinus sp. SDUM040013]|uniref:Uncharacterized protein n=1 Tax=Gilvimarinus gilvus TaxID=3058038 RepID=A0ABU4RYI5_9GAMM|nr:hypothetical protein [Gilvimarinus sp. SDUM040013]MDO3387926.1 hypothetical protein [Gilvimarinus sp. SDUM040013]MDX6848703.1 hypothetical protein [Gilvimarinus sp. SDUM040013]
MKKLSFNLLLFTTFLLLSIRVSADLMEPSLDPIYELIEKGQYKEALIQHQNYFEDSANVPGLSGVRLSFALGNWAELGQLYPPALTALKELAQAKRAQLLDGDGNFTIFSEYESINSYINKGSETIETFLKLEEFYPDQASRYYNSIERLLMSEKRYEIIARHIKDPIYKFETIRHHREYEMGRLRSGDKHASLDYANKYYHQELSRLLATTKAIGMIDYAKEIERRSEQYLTESSRFKPNEK